MYNYIISGKFKGRKIFIPKTDLRPTTNLVREALFSIIGENIIGKSFLDVFAGSGIIGIEALSRGALSSTFVDSDKKATDTIKRNLNLIYKNDKKQLDQKNDSLINNLDNHNSKHNIDNNENSINNNLEKCYKIYNLDFRKFFKINNEKFDYIFFSPPYFQKLEEDILNCLYLYKPLKENGTAILQIFKKVDINIENKNLLITDERRYGITKLIFLRNK